MLWSALSLAHQPIPPTATRRRGAAPLAARTRVRQVIRKPGRWIVRKGRDLGLHPHGPSASRPSARSIVASQAVWQSCRTTNNYFYVDQTATLAKTVTSTLAKLDAFSKNSQPLLFLSRSGRLLMPSVRRAHIYRPKTLPLACVRLVCRRTMSRQARCYSA